MDRIVKDTGDALRKEYDPMLTQVFMEQSSLKIVLAADCFNEMDSDKRVSSVKKYLRLAVPYFDDVPVRFFIISSEEYRQAYKCPTFNGI